MSKLIRWRQFAKLSALILPGLFSQSALAQEAPQRVISLSPHGAELVFALGAGDRLVGTSEHSDYPEAAQAVPRVSGYQGVQLEQILLLKPDLIITWSGGNKADDLERLAELGFTLYDSSPKAPMDIATDLENLGQALGVPERSQVLAEDFQARLQALEQTYQGRAPVRVFYQLWSDPLMSVGQGSWLDTLIHKCGGRNVFHDASSAYPQVSVENVVIAQPQAILVPQGETGDNSHELWGDWPQIPAVTADQFYALDADLLHRTTPRMLEGMTSLCQAIDQSRASLAIASAD